jgi:hypothetical protein
MTSTRLHVAKGQTRGALFIFNGRSLSALKKKWKFSPRNNPQLSLLVAHFDAKAEMEISRMIQPV